MKRITILCVLLSLLSANAYAVDFNKFIIAPSSNTDFKGTIYFADWLKVDPVMPCEDKKREPNKWTLIDQEGGVVARLGVAGSVPPVPSQAVKDGLQDFQAKLDKVGQTLKQACIDVNLAPVADTNFMHSAMDRAYSSNPDIANQYASVFSNAMASHGVVPTWKHYPGYTDKTYPISHTDKLYTDNYNPRFVEPSIITSSKDEIEKAMTAFKDNGHNLLMLNSAVFTAFGNRPAIFNSEIIGKAKVLQPNSLLISDDLSELKLDDDKIVYLFNNVDLFLFSSEKEALSFSANLNRLYGLGKISENDVKNKKLRIAKWEIYWSVKSQYLTK